MKYTEPEWLNQRWSTLALLAMTEESIQAKQAEIEQHIVSNNRLYHNGLTQIRQEREEFKAAFPRRRVPSELYRSAAKPPSLLARWGKLLAKRQAALRKNSKQKTSKRAVFVENMLKGKVNAQRNKLKNIDTKISLFLTSKNIPLPVGGIEAKIDALLAYLNEGKA